MVLGFKKQFKTPIVKGDKIHTIREDKNNRWKAGNLIHFATGVRTKEYNNFLKDTCKSVQDIEIDYTKTFLGEPTIKIDGKTLVHTEIVTLAFNDGFHSLEEFLAWFNKDFRGKIIHWTNFAYNGNKNS